MKITNSYIKNTNLVSLMKCTFSFYILIVFCALPSYAGQGGGNHIETPAANSDLSVSAPMPAVQDSALVQSAISPNAQPSSSKQPSIKANSTAQIANLIGGLLLIMVLIFGLSWFVKRFSQGGFMQNPAIKMLAAMPLGTRERIMLVEVGGKQLLLGVTATQISSLHVFDEPVIHPMQKSTNNTESSDFSQKLMAILQQKNTTSSNADTSNDVEK